MNNKNNNPPAEFRISENFVNGLSYDRYLNRFDDYIYSFNDTIERGEEDPILASEILETKGCELKRLVGICLKFTKSEVTRPHPLKYIISSSWKADASIHVKKNHHEVALSWGLLWALEDLYLRLATDIKFFSKCPYSNEFLWKGAASLITTGFEKSQPAIRYMDYSPVFFSTPVNSVVMDDVPKTTLSHHIECLPAEHERLRLVDLLMMVSVIYIIAHEEAHYDCGHIDYTNSITQFNAFEEAEKTSVEPDEFDGNLLKVLELDADFAAVRHVFGTVQSDYFYSHLPSYCQDDKEMWMTRAVVSAISSLTLVLQKRRILTGASQDHPSPTCRAVATAFSINDELCNFPKSIKDDVIIGIQSSFLEEVQIARDEIERGGSAEFQVVDPFYMKRGGIANFTGGNMANSQKEFSTQILRKPNVKLDIFPDKIETLYFTARLEEILKTKTPKGALVDGIWVCHGAISKFEHVLKWSQKTEPEVC